jgi:dihydroorotase
VYDLIIRDATIVTGAGREVADVAIKDGRIAYVGPRPRRNAKEEISAIGRFLVPGVIDTAVQFDPDGVGKSWERESLAAVTGGITTVLALPQGKHPVVDSASAKARLDRIQGQSWVNYGLWAAATDGQTNDLQQATQKHLVQGTLAYPGREDCLGIPTDKVVSYMGNPGVLGVQLERILHQQHNVELLLQAVRASERPMHLLHLSTSEELQYLDPVRGETMLTAGVTPHHLFLSSADEPPPLPHTINTFPPVRAEHDRRTLWTAVKRGRLDCVASDHYAGNGGGFGVPGSELLFPLLLSAVKYGRLNLELLVSLCSESPAQIFGLERKGRIEKGLDADMVLFSEGEIARVDEGSLLSSAGWSPYADREVAPKPNIVIVQGKVIARDGQIVGKKPTGKWVGAQ